MTHWTGKDDDEKGCETLSIISSTCQLKLSSCDHHFIDINNKICLEMTCFTDVPFFQTNQHCLKYGKFGIVFNKKDLINIGAQSVFYWTPNVKRHLDYIYKWIKENSETSDQEFYKAIHYHFAFMKQIKGEQGEKVF